MTKPNWACIKCGTGFGRKSSAKRHVNTVHQGHAKYVPWSEYLAGRTTGIYFPSQPPRQGTPKHTPTDTGERLNYTLLEGFFNEVGRVVARQALTPSSYKLPAFARATPYAAIPYFGDNIFGIQAYICHNCLAAKPSRLCFVEGDKGDGRTYYFFCSPNAARNPGEFGSSKEEFLSAAKKICCEVLAASVLAWMGNPPELIVVGIGDPNRYMGRITFLKSESGKTFSITLDYSEDKCIEMDASQIASWATIAISNGRTTLDSSELSEFLGMTETTSYGFFRLGGKPSRTFLMALAKTGSNTTLHPKKVASRFFPMMQPTSGI